ncbi:MAG: ACP phosphodiesterase [Flavobacteriaceae bacterium]|nr:ACP phosphodiesterase [Flavobacteriaceae bacterium]|tara:strand:- start:6250 stop:6840 length:591 start_codon:yes stop_codon:yes gene_type:complete
MNYLAHVYLSGDNMDIAIGNFIADDIKGNNYKDYKLDWQRGILLHRFIDSFTDSHKIFRDHSKLFFNSHRHYSRVLVDIYYDYFLAKNWTKYSSLSLPKFETNFSDHLKKNLNRFPNKLFNKISFFINHKLFSKYSSIEGLSFILKKMDIKTKYKSNMSDSINKFILFAPEMEIDFFIFFEDLIYNVNSYLNKEIL